VQEKADPTIDCAIAKLALKNECNPDRNRKRGHANFKATQARQGR
jgi:hypothetical protein